MVYAIQNSETGEVDYIYADCTTVEQIKYDEETGEPLNGGKLKVRYRKHGNFHIPKRYLRGTCCDEFEKFAIDQYQCTDIKVTSSAEPQPLAPLKKKQMYEREDYIKMDGVNNNIILGYSKSNYRLFLIPTLFCFNFVVFFFLALLELILHCWAHKKNRLTMNKDLYFRSPMHVLSSQFCAICRSESDGMEFKIFDELNKQMRNARKSNALKDVTKAIG